MTQPKIVVRVELECPHGCKGIWESDVLCVDFKGALYKHGECPECGRTGRRLTITSESISALFSDDEIANIGQEAIHSMLWLTAAMLDEETLKEKKPILTIEEIAGRTAQSRDQVRAHIDHLEDLEWIVRKGSATSYLTGAPEWEFTLGAKLKKSAFADGLPHA